MKYRPLRMEALDSRQLLTSLAGVTMDSSHDSATAELKALDSTETASGDSFRYTVADNLGERLAAIVGMDQFVYTVVDDGVT